MRFRIDLKSNPILEKIENFDFITRKFNTENGFWNCEKCITCLFYDKFQHCPLCAFERKKLIEEKMKRHWNV